MEKKEIESILTTMGFKPINENLYKSDSCGVTFIVRMSLRDEGVVQLCVSFDSGNVSNQCYSLFNYSDYKDVLKFLSDFREELFRLMSEISRSIVCAVTKLN